MWHWRRKKFQVQFFGLHCKVSWSMQIDFLLALFHFVIFSKQSFRDTTVGVCLGRTSDVCRGNDAAREKCREKSIRRSRLPGKLAREQRRERQGQKTRKGLLFLSVKVSLHCLLVRLRLLENCTEESAWWHSCGFWRQEVLAFSLESQWSNRHVCHFMEQSIDCG